MLNNSISSHRTNIYTPCLLAELLVNLQSKRRQTSAIVYCRRTGIPDIFEDLRKTEIIVIKTTGNLISSSKGQNPAFLRKYLQLLQSSELELKSLRVVLSYRYHLPGIFSKNGPRPRSHRRDGAGQKRGKRRCWRGTFRRSRTTNKW